MAAVASFVPDSLLDGRPPQLQARADAIEVALDRLHAEAIEIAAAALDSFPPQLNESPASEILLQRLEGIGIVDADGAYLIWQGSPADPPRNFNDIQGTASWSEERGTVSRWIVRAGPDAEGWLSLASFTLRSQEHGGGLEALLPEDLFAGVDVVLRLGAEDDPGTTQCLRHRTRNEDVLLRYGPAVRIGEVSQRESKRADPNRKGVVFSSG